MEVIIHTYVSCPNCRKWDLIESLVHIPDIVFKCGYCGLCWDEGYDDDDDWDKPDLLWGAYPERQQGRFWPFL